MTHIFPINIQGFSKYPDFLAFGIILLMTCKLMVNVLTYCFCYFKRRSKIIPKHRLYRVFKVNPVISSSTLLDLPKQNDFFGGYQKIDCNLIWRINLIFSRENLTAFATNFSRRARKNDFEN